MWSPCEMFPPTDVRTAQRLLAWLANRHTVRCVFSFFPVVFQ